MRASRPLDRALVPAAARAHHIAQLDQRRGEQRLDLKVGVWDRHAGIMTKGRRRGGALASSPLGFLLLARTGRQCGQQMRAVYRSQDARLDQRPRVESIAAEQVLT